MIALDNFVPNDAREQLVPYVDVIKVDIKKVPPEDTAAMIGRYASQGCQMLAQKVESRQDLVTAKKAGFTRFQGYFFRNTEHLRARQ